MGIKLPDDQNDWNVEHPSIPGTIEWLTSWVRSGLLHITLHDLIEFDHDYPGILRDVDTVVWQIEIIKKQLEGKK